MNDNDWKKEAFKAVALVTQLGLVVIISILIPLAVGYFVDKLIGTQMAFKILGLVLGVAAGYWNGAKTVKKFLEKL